VKGQRAEYEQWRLAIDEGGAASTSTTKRIRQLERELARKEKALAEAAALLILKKKVDTLYGEDEDDDTNGPNER
jgi:transposase